MKAACPKCRQASPLQFRIGDLNRRITAEVFDYFRCPACAIIFLSPIPGSIGKYYENAYYDIPDSIEKLASSAEPERFKIEMVRRFATQGRLLEIGSAWGNFAYLAKQAGFQVDAMEMDAACCLFLRDVLGITAIRASDVEAALQEAETYDVIALWHVIEHLPDPWSVLEMIAQKLNPGGLVIMAAPNPNSIQFRILGRFWAHLDAPRHLELIPVQALVDHGQKLGLSSLLVTTTDQGSLGWNMFGWAVSLGNMSSNRNFSRGLNFVGRIISRILAPIENKEGRGSAYTVILRKGVCE